MHDGSILDLGIDPRFARSAKGRALPAGLPRFAMLAALFLLGGAIALGAMGIMPAMRAIGLSPTEGKAVVRLPLEEFRRVADMNVDDRAQIVVEGADAQERNAALPKSGLPLEQVRGFSLADLRQGNGATALKCLTQAVYYEAAFEPIEGRRAVAQVVLNRMRHPAYPKTVCGVVYQGSQRRTGCQFSFTCDGALLRSPAPGAWREAESVARAALAGHVEPGVGTATHYHADYVLPKWAFRLGKISQLGRHIFYRFNGSWGRAAAFSGPYGGNEYIPAINFAALRQRASQQRAEANTPGLTVPPHVTDRHSESDVGGRLDVSKQWRLTIPDPVKASSRYHESVEQTSGAEKPSGRIALAPQAAPQTGQ